MSSDNWSSDLNSDECNSRIEGTAKCPNCGATWMNGVLYWSTGKQGRNIDLAGLVCNMFQDTDKGEFIACPNPCKGNEGGDTWSARLKFIRKNMG